MYGRRMRCTVRSDASEPGGAASTLLVVMDSVTIEVPMRREDETSDGVAVCPRRAAVGELTWLRFGATEGSPGQRRRPQRAHAVQPTAPSPARPDPGRSAP